MMGGINCSKLLGVTKLDNSYEFNFALALAKCCTCFDTYLDMSMMRVEQSTIPDSSLEKFRYYIQEGYIFIGEGVKPSEPLEKPETEIDVSFYNDVVLYDKVDDSVVEWSFAWADKNYGDNAIKFTIYRNRGFLALSIVAYFLLKRHFGLESAKRIRLTFNTMETKNVHYYLDLYGCKKSLDWFDDMVDLHLDMREAKSIDLDYSLFCRDSYFSKRYGAYTSSEKSDLIKKLGWVVGDILVLWERTGMCTNNKFGNLKSSTILRLDEIGNDYLGVTEIHVNKTKEEITLDYNEMDEESKRLFYDVLYKDPFVKSKILSLYSLGIGEYFGDEELILTELDKKETVVKTITIDNEVTTVEISGVDAIYWLMCQNNIEFDKIQYKERYSKDKDLLWDMYHND